MTVDPQHQIGFAQIGIGSVLSQHTLIVPPNQREYSWTEREVSGLLQDLYRALSENAAEYFLGSIVTIPKRLSVLEVVDGQQRLATTAILLAAIRDALKGRAADALIIERIEHTFLTTIDAQARELVSRLRLNLTDAAYFDQRVLRGEDVEGKARSHRLIDNARELAGKHVAQILMGYNEKEYGDVLNRWVEFLEHKAIVILLKVPTDVNAYKMFETLNDRGLRTSQADLVKNYLFGQSDDRIAEAQQKWASMKALLESITDDDEITITFMRQMLISMYGHVKDYEVYDRVQRNARGAGPAIQFLTRLENGAADYVALLSPDNEKWNDYPASTRRAIQTLVLLRMRPMRPLMLSIARAMPPAEADRALRMVVNLSVRYLIVGGMRTGTVEETFAAAAQGTSEGTITTVGDLIAFLEKVTPQDLQFEEQFKVTTVSVAGLARYYLRSLEMAVKNEPDPYFIPNDDQSVINLEHVLPGRPGDNWPSFTVETVPVFHRRLGNMALLRAKTNANLHSAPFSEKRKVYAGTPYEWTSQIADLPDWTPETISQRQAKMASVAVKTWRITAPSKRALERKKTMRVSKRGAPKRRRK